MIFKGKSISKTLAAVVVIIIIIIAGVGAYYYYMSTITPSSKITGSITVAAEAGYNDAALEQIAKNYMASHPGTTINVVTLSFDTALTSYQTAFSSGIDTYDVVFFPNVGYLGSIAQYLVNLKPYLSNKNYFPASYNISDIVPSMLSPFEINGSLYGLPCSGDVMLFYYRLSYFNNVTNQKLFLEQYGYPLPTSMHQRTKELHLLNSLLTILLYKLTDRGILSLDMESSAIFTVARLRKLKAGSILATSENFSRNIIIPEQVPEQLKEGWKKATQVALKAIEILENKKK